MIKVYCKYCKELVNTKEEISISYSRTWIKCLKCSRMIGYTI